MRHVEERPVAVVTGGARGIGAEVCRRLAADGMAVAVFDVLEDEAGELAEDLKDASAHQVDVGDYESVTAGVEAVLERWERIDVLVNNAGWDRMQAFLENDPQMWDRLIAVNLRGPIHVCHAALPTMVTQGSGRVVNVASDAGGWVPRARPSTPRARAG
jgi:2-hydroxycyclohexanecarboxyl-CoA dehydrogenase